MRLRIVGTLNPILKKRTKGIEREKGQLRKQKPKKKAVDELFNSDNVTTEV